MNELTLRIVTAIGLVAVALIAAVMGGYVFAVLAALAATGMFYEWMRIVRGWGAMWAIWLVFMGDAWGGAAAYALRRAPRFVPWRSIAGRAGATLQA